MPSTTHRPAVAEATAEHPVLPGQFLLKDLVLAGVSLSGPRTGHRRCAGRTRRTSPR